MIQCINNNQGFVMALLTLVYVGATIAICIFNNRSAKVAATQLEEMKASQEQYAKLQLHDKRYLIYSLLLKWNYIAEEALKNENPLQRENPLMTPHNTFEAMIFCDSDNDVLNRTNLSLLELNMQYGAATDETRPKIEEMMNSLSMQRDLLGITALFDSKQKIDMAEFIFPIEIYEKALDFSEVFVDTVMQKKYDNLQELKTAHAKFKEANVLDKMKEYLIIE